MSISEPFINRPVMTVLLSVTASIFGIFAYFQLPVSDLPDVDYPVIQVKANYPGASPQTMASNIASPLEQKFMQIQGIEMITSSSTLGNTNIVLQFELDKSIDTAATEVQSAINQATGNLPGDLPSPPTYTKTNPNDKPIYYLGLLSTSMTMGQLYDYAFTSIAQRMNILEGVSAVNIYGSPRSVNIEVDPQELYKRGLSFNNLVDAIKSGTNLIGAGELKGENITLTIEPETQLSFADDYNNLIIAVKEGRPIYLRDVATAINGIQTEDLQMDYWASFVPENAVGIVLAIQKADGANTVNISKQIKEFLPVLREQTPPSIVIAPIYDRSTTITASIFDVQETLLIAFVLVCIVIFIFLGRARDTVIPIVALPLSLLLTFICMHYLGYSLDNLSLMALTLAIGFLVDDAVVFLENMVRRMEDFGEAPHIAAVNGAKEISFTILSMTLSLAAVFIPLIFMSGLMGRIFREFGMTITIAVVMSGIVSLSLTPMMCARMLKERKNAKQTKMEILANKIESACLKVYDPSLSFFLKHRWISALGWILCMAGVVIFGMMVPKTFIPVGDSGFISGVFITNPGTSPTKMRKIQSQLNEVIKANPAVENFVSVSGVGSFIQNNFGLAFISLIDEDKRQPIEIVNQELVSKMSKIPGVIPLIRPNPTLELSTGATGTNQGQYAYSLSGLDTDQIYEGSQKLIGAMYESGLFSSVSSDLFLNNPQLDIEILREQASTFGVTPTNIATVLKDAYSLNYNYLIKSPFFQYQVIVEAAPKWRSSINDLDYIYFDSATNQNVLYVNNESAVSINNNMVPFASVAKTSLTVGPVAVNHINNFSSVTIFFDVAPGVAIGDATNFIETTAKKLVSQEVMTSFQGQALLFKQTVVSMALMAIVAVFVMYIILGILYESYIHPITVLTSLPIAIVGGLATLLLLDQELSLYAAIGMFMLMGIVKKNGIMMIDFAIMRQDEGRSPREAVHEACMERFRPIIMTTMAMLFGILPIALGWGADAESRKPLGCAIVGGLIFSQLITLYITPALFLYFEDFQTKVMDKIPFFARGDRMK